MSSSSHSSFSQLGNSWSDGERSIVCEDEQAGESCQSERIWSISSLTDSPAGASDSLSMCEEQTEESFKSENIWSSQACTEEDEGNEEEESPSLGNLSSDKINNTSTGVRDHFIAPHQGGAGASTAYKQQTLPAQQLILTVRTVLPAFFIIGLIYIPIGIALYVSSNNIKDFEVDYTGVDTSSPCYSCAKNLMWNSTGPCLCTVTFSLDQPFENNVFMYYGLSNFYQSHRRYVNSRDDSQLTGNPFALKNPSTVCEPYRTSDGLPIAPCGAIANSLFNDTLELYYIVNGTRTVIPMVKEGIAWQKDKYKKFRNPKGNKNLTVAFQGTTKPVNWRKSVYELDPYDPKNNGFINEDLLVWMRTAALPTFRKLYRIIQKKPNTTSTLPSGNYELDITYNYPVLSFDGRKRMILSTISWMGGKNPFLGIAYITVGSICFFLGVALLIIHWYWDYWNYWENFKV